MRGRGAARQLGYPVEEAAIANRLRGFGADPGSRVLLAEVENEVAGLVATHIVPRLEDDRASCRIVAIVTAARHRRAGVGTALINAAATDAAARGARRLDLSSGDWRADAHSFYERLGFVNRARSFTRWL